MIPIFICDLLCILDSYVCIVKNNYRLLKNPLFYRFYRAMPGAPISQQRDRDSMNMPLSNPRFDEKDKQMVDADVEVIEQICKEDNTRMDPITENEVKAALKRLNNNNAVDVMGLTAEHFKLAGQELSVFLTCFLNYVIDMGTVSVVLKEGILTPIFKKGDPSNPGNYRGISVTPVMLKILEHILNARHSHILMNTQSKLQKGFTPGCSSLNAAFILSEQDLFLTTLHAQKAFDVVDQNSLLRKLYLDGIRGNDWLLLKELYSDCSSMIKWAGELSDPINIKQGVRQGGVLSTGHYKRYNNPMLLQLEKGYSGIKIGSISIPYVTVADDLVILAGSKSENQAMVWDVEDSSNRERCCVHPAKSHILWYKFGKKRQFRLGCISGGYKGGCFTFGYTVRDK